MTSRLPRSDLLVAVTLIAVATFLFGMYAFERTNAIAAMVSTIIFTCMFAPMIIVGVPQWADGMRRHFAASPLLFPMIAFCSFVGLMVFADATGQLATRSLITLGLIGAVAYYLVSVPAPVSAWRYWLAILLLWLPHDFHLVYGVKLPPTGGLEAETMLIFTFALVLYTLVKPLPDIGYRLTLRRPEIKTALTGFLGFTAIVVPLALWMRFIHWHIAQRPWYETIGLTLGIYFFTAIPEEFCFRGVMQNLLQRWWSGRAGSVAALVVASIIFGAAHLNNHPGSFPNFRYMFLATIAGLFYGWVWKRTRSITASALTHAAVDWVWITLFKN